MNLLARYITRQLTIGLVVVTVVLILAILLTQSMRLIQFIVEGGASPWMFLRLVFLSMPEFLIAILPIGAVAAILFVYNRLLADGELLVMRSAGVGQAALAAPGLIVAVLTMLLSFLMNLYFLPIASREFRDMRAMIQSNYSAALLQTGDFNAIGEGMTVYIRERDALGGLHGILLHDARDPLHPATMIAEAGVIRDVDTQPKVVLLSGQRQVFDRNTGRIETLQFDQYSVDLDLVGPNFSRSYRQPNERFINELLFPDLTSRNDRNNYERLITEGHTRLTVPLLPVAFGVMALGFMLRGGFDRRGLGRRILATVAFVVGIEAIYLMVAGAARENLLLIPVMYLIPALTTVFGVVLLTQARARRARRPGHPAPAPAPA